MKTIKYKNCDVQVSRDGKTIICNGKKLQQGITGKTSKNSGYYRVYIQGLVFVHRLVAVAYVNNPDPAKFNIVAFHNPKLSLKPHFKNLYWKSATTTRRNDKGQRVLCTYSRLSLDDCLRIEKLYREKRFTQDQLAARYVVGRTTIQRALSKALEHHNQTKKVRL